MLAPHAWDRDELLRQIQMLLPSGTRIVETPEGDASFCTAAVVHGEEMDGETKVVVDYSESGLSELDALFTLYYRLAPRVKDGIWGPQTGRPSRKAIAANLSQKYADPEDIDPEEVASVYRQK